jgi:cytochrome c5
MGDNAAWAGLWAAGLDATVSNAINGKGGMPPRGGSDATDEEMRAAVVYMFKQAGLE